MTDVEKYVLKFLKETDCTINRAIAEVANLKGVEYEEVEKYVRFAPISSPMTGSEIETDLGVTRQNISQILKRGLRKVYFSVRKTDPTMTPFEIACHISSMLNVDKSQDEMVKFFNLFPPELKKTIKESGMDQCRIEDQERMREEERIQAMQELLQLQEKEQQDLL